MNSAKSPNNEHFIVMKQNVNVKKRTNQVMQRVALISFTFSVNKHLNMAHLYGKVSATIVQPMGSYAPSERMNEAFSYNH